MKLIGNIIWLLLGGIETALGYFSGSIALMLTIVGIPFGLQTLKLGFLCLWPFGSNVSKGSEPAGCIRIPMNIIWLLFGGIWVWLTHMFFGLLLCITIVGIPFGRQHFKMAGLALTPFGRDVNLNF